MDSCFQSCMERREGGVNHWPKIVLGFDFDARVLDAGGGKDFGIKLLAHAQHGERVAFGAHVVTGEAGCGEFNSGRENEGGVFAETVQCSSGFECFLRLTEEFNACTEPLQASHRPSANDNVVQVIEEFAEKRDRLSIDSDGDQIRTVIGVKTSRMRDDPAKAGVCWYQV